MIGDVTGHGPDEAALGVSLRIAWRTLVLSGVPADRLLPVLQEVLVRERPADEVFATVCMVAAPPSRDRACMWLAGHHAPLLLDPRPTQVPVEFRGPMLGLRADGTWPCDELRLGSSWRLVLFTDGWIEGRVDGGPARLGVSGLLELAENGAPGPVPALLDRLLEQVHELNGRPLSDDVALVALEWHGPDGQEARR
jgi:serine phosphatase RsbU (regulator of sigma subunit)